MSIEWRNGVVTDDELHAYADGQLPEKRIPAVEAHILADPQSAARVKDYRAINAALRQAFAFAPPQTPATRPRSRPFQRMAVAAALAGLVLGGAGGWMSREYLHHAEPVMRQLAQHASAAYQVFAPDQTHPVEMTAQESERLAAWLSERMRMHFRIPELDQAGFALVGGRLMVGEGKPAGMLMYENKQGRRIVLYVRNDLPSGSPSRMSHESTANGTTVYWRDSLAGFALAGGFSEQELRPVANMIRDRYAS